MKRFIASIVLALPLAALCVMPKSASAEPVNRDSTYNRQPENVQRDNRGYNNDRQLQSIQRDNRDSNYNRQPVINQRDNRSDDRGREPNSDRRYGSRHQRQWVAAHYERVNHHRRWVPGHYVYQ